MANFLWSEAFAVAASFLVFLPGDAIAQPPIPRGEKNCPCTPLAECVAGGGLIPCDYDIYFSSFTHVDGPALDKKAELTFDVDVDGLGFQTFDHTDTETGEGVTRLVNEVCGRTVRVDCGATNESVTVSIKAREKDKFIDDLGEGTIVVPLECPPLNDVATYTTTIDVGDGKHTVDVEFHVISKNPSCTGDDDSIDCPEVPIPSWYVDTPSSCSFQINALTLTRLDAPDIGLAMDFYVEIYVNHATYYEWDQVAVDVGETATLENMGILFGAAIPCCSDDPVSVPIRLTVQDIYDQDRGEINSEITLSCPPDEDDDVLEYNIDLLSAAGTGYPTHSVEIALLTSITNVDFCAMPPLPPKVRPCQMVFTLIDVTHTDAPALDRRGEFAFEFTIGDSYATWAYADGVELDETMILNERIRVVTIPCGGDRTVPFAIRGIENDRDLNVFDIVNIENAEERATETGLTKLSCKPLSNSVVRTYTLDFVNDKGKAKHTAKLRIEQRLVNWSTACECTEPTTSSADGCDLEVVFHSFHHDDTDTGDDPGDFQFTFWLNSQKVGPLFAGGREVVLADVDKGSTVVVDDIFQHFGGSSLLGTWFNSHVRLPSSSYILPLRIDVRGEEVDSFFSDTGYATVERKLHCGIADAELPVTIDIEFRGRKKVKHTGTITLIVREV